MFSRLIGTKTFWVGIAGAVGGVLMIVKGQTTEGIMALGAAIQSIFIRDAIAKQ